MKSLALAALLLALALPTRADALEFALLDTPLRLQFSEYALVAYHVGNGNIAPPKTIAYDPTGAGYGDWINRFQVDASWGSFSALLRLNTALYLTPPIAAPGDKRIEFLLQNRFRNRVDLEKVAVAWSSRHLEVTVGDAYVTYGRGLVLSVRKLDEAGIDTTIRGAHVTGRVAGLTADLVGGLGNIVNVDPATTRSADDPGDLLGGGHLEYRFGNWVVPGINASILQLNRHPASDGTPPDESRPIDRTASLSATLELPHIGPFGQLFVEYAQQYRRVAGDLTTGRAFYASGSGFFGPVTVQAEWKDYRDFRPLSTSLDPISFTELALSDFYSAPPTLERLLQPILNNYDVWGPHGRVDWAITQHVAPFVSMAVFGDRVYDVRIYDPYAGVEATWGESRRGRLSLSGGLRTARFLPEAGEAAKIFQDTWHAEFDLIQGLGGGYSAEIDGVHFSVKDHQSRGYLRWHQGQVYASIKKADAWALASGYEYYTEAPASLRPGYVNLSATLFVAKGTQVRLFAGGQRAGIKCVNGVCRNYPAFEGVRAELLARF